MNSPDRALCLSYVEADHRRATLGQETNKDLKVWHKTSLSYAQCDPASSVKLEGTCTKGHDRQGCDTADEMPDGDPSARQPSKAYARHVIGTKLKHNVGGIRYAIPRSVVIAVSLGAARWVFQHAGSIKVVVGILRTTGKYNLTVSPWRTRHGVAVFTNRTESNEMITLRGRTSNLVV